MHKPISLKHISLFFADKLCVEDFSAHIHFARRIAIIGRNGCGKSTLLQLLMGLKQPTSGKLHVPDDVSFSYVPQVIEEFACLSGGQRFNKSLTAALSSAPNVLLLDEPTNHLDSSNRKSLFRKLNHFYGTLIIVTHDIELLRSCVDELWHMENGCITKFSGSYDDYIRECASKRQSVAKKLAVIKQEKQQLHASLMQEQQRAAKSKRQGQKHIVQRKWPTVKSHAKTSRALTTSDRKKTAIDKKKSNLIGELSALQLPAVIVPTFNLLASVQRSGTLLSVSQGSIGYVAQTPLVSDINLSLSSAERMAILGDNGSGKTTFIKALMGADHVIRSGDWKMPAMHDIGYLDQHYANVVADKSVLDSFVDWVPAWSMTAVRCHLSDFLFKTNHEVNTLGGYLSGGEKARFSLALIAAKPPKLLILDEITNNLDLETKAHVAQILKDYPAAMIVVSHDQEFLDHIAIDVTVSIKDGGIVSA